LLRVQPNPNPTIGSWHQFHVPCSQVDMHYGCTC